MEIKELKAADVLLFSGETGSFISQAIMYLTDAPVSHAALSYTDCSTIIEETPPAVATSNAAQRFTGRTITVMRLRADKGTMQPVTDAAAAYLNNNAPYANFNLYLVGMLLVFRKFTPSGSVQRAILKILRKLTATIIDYVNQHRYPGKLPMVCSQFVYQSYEDAGADYRLQIKNGLLLQTLKTAGETPSILDQSIARIRNTLAPELQSLANAYTAADRRASIDESDEDLASELLSALQEMPLAAERVEIGDELVIAVHEFGQAVLAAKSGITASSDALSRANQLGMAPEGLAYLKSEEAYFVAPGDLLNACPDLEAVGTITGA